MACSEPLLVAGRFRLVTNTNRCCRHFLIIRLELFAFVAFWRDAQKFVEPFVELGGITVQGGVGQFLAAPADGVLHIAQQMGETDLMLFRGPTHLGSEPVGDPIVGAIVTQERFDHSLAPAGRGDEATVLAVMENPGPPGFLADPTDAPFGIGF